MNLSQWVQRFHCICFAIAAVFSMSACHEQESGVELSPANHAMIVDSIVTLDSMAMAFKHTDSARSCNYATRAVTLAEKTGTTEYLISALNIQGLVFSVNHHDAAQAIFSHALRLTDSTSFKRERSSIFYNMAKMYLDANDYKTSIVLLDSSIQTGIRHHQPKAVCVSLIALANVYHISDEPSMAKMVYDSAWRIASKYHLSRETGIALGNLSLYCKNRQESERMAKDAIRLMEQEKGAEEEIANCLLNLGLVQSNPDSAIKYYTTAISLAQKCRINKATMAAYNNMAYAYLEKHDVEMARSCIADNAIPLANTTGDYDWLATLYDTYADVMIAQKSYGEAVDWLRKSNEARAISDHLIAKKQVRMLNAVLEMKNKNLVIIEKENQLTIKNARISRMELWLALAAALLLITGASFLLFRQGARNKMHLMKLESAQKIIEAEEHEKEKNGMELHDAIGSLGLKISETFEQHPETNKVLTQTLWNHISNFSEEIRNMSHRMSKKILERHRIAPLLENLCQENLQYGSINLQYKIGAPVSEIPADVSMHLFRIVQELLTNARKYACNANITLVATFAENAVTIEYRDNGVGFSPEADVKKGMGLSNIFARVNLLNGTAELDAVPGHGVYWKIIANF